MDIAAWLRGLGLEQYERAFSDNDIGAELLPTLTAADLRELGVVSLGHRKRLLAAIAALAEPAGGARPPAAPPAAPEPRSPAPPPSAAQRAERRQLTVLFCDLVGSTALAARLDPEDLGEVVRSYQAACAAVIARYDGHLAEFLGDGVLAHFGHPRAHEDDAERAVRAGLALVEAVGGLAPPGGPALRVRVGVATGLVVVGDVIGAGEAREPGVVGATPNLAARLQAMAEPDAVVVGAGTRRLVAGLFDLAELGAHELKGFAAPVPAWRVLGPRRAADRFEVRQAATGLTPLVGREAELGLLLDRRERARDGEGQLVLLGGEPGVGKSRLVRALRERLGGEAHAPRHYQCSPHHTDTALHPVVTQLESAVGFRPGDVAEARLDKLEALIRRGRDDAAVVAPLFAELLSIPTGGRYPPLDVPPRRRRELLLAALLDQLAGLAAERPALVVFEDAHWMDPTTTELVGLIAERARELPVLLLVTFRPEFTPPWTHHAHATLLTVGRLGRREAAAMVDRVAGRALPAEMVAEIAAKADGVPLFVEELTKAVLEAGMPGGEDGTPGHCPAGPEQTPVVPVTLEDSLMARLDRAPAARELAQVAAAIGREFRHDLLAAVAPRGEDGLRAALARLLEAGLVFRRGTPPEATYAFKHALVRDAAYGSLLRGRRRELHARIAEALEVRFPERAEREPELLARHWAQAGLAEKAAAYRHLAGRRAIARSAMAEAVAQLRAGLDALADVPDGPGRRSQELDLQLALATALAVARSFVAPETGEALARARELCREENDPHRIFHVLNGQFMFHSQQSEPHAAHEVAVEMLERARREGDAALLIPAHRATCVASFHLGRFAAAREHAEQALALYDPARHRPLASLYSFDQRAMALGYLCTALLALGHLDQAEVRSREHLAWAREVNHPTSLARAQAFACLYHFAARDPPALLRRAAEATIATCAEHGLPFYLGIGKIVRGHALIKQGAVEDGLADIEEGRATLEASGSRMLLNVSALIAEAHARAGRHREALRWAAEAQAQTEASRSFWLKAEEFRRRGRLLLSLPESDRAEAEACLQRAIEVARAQGARTWELRAAADLARLWRDQARYREARDLLAPIYGWFTEGFDLPDLRDAKALLDTLA